MRSRFLTSLQLVMIEEKKWKLMAPFKYISAELKQEIVVPQDFITDFASVPRLPLAFLLAGDTAHKAAVIHDYLYRCSDVKRGVADSVFLEAMEVSGVPWWRRWTMYSAVRSFGWSSKKNLIELNP